LSGIIRNGLLVLQALLLLIAPIRLHRWLGYANLILAALMIAAGLLVIAVRMDSGLRGIARASVPVAPISTQVHTIPAI
jgi:hypothetical protein